MKHKIALAFALSATILLGCFESEDCRYEDGVCVPISDDDTSEEDATDVSEEDATDVSEEDATDVSEEDVASDDASDTAAEPICGDGVVSEGEACDTGDDNSDTAPDACRTTCVEATCGDGTIDTGEECDDGVDNSDTTPGACRVDCTEPVCGDGIVDEDLGEECDTGGNNSDTTPGACRTSCLEATCGDGAVDPGEECDTGDANSDTNAGACRTTCLEATCGDGVVDINLGEECDDGADNSDTTPDACRLDCSLPFCGDGVVDTNSGEDCDDASNPGSAVGECVPGCSGRVQQVLRLQLSQPLNNDVAGNFADGQDFTTVADGLCPFGYKAMIVDGTNRVASVTPLAADGQVDWVLEPFTAYYDDIPLETRWPAGFDSSNPYTGRLVWTTDDVNLLGVRDGALVDLPLPSGNTNEAFDKSGRPIWTGLNPDWTTGNTCQGWTTNDVSENGVIGNTSRENAGLWSVTDNDCSLERQVICAEQPFQPSP